MIVGEASIEVLAATDGFGPELEAGTAGPLDALDAQAAAAGEKAGASLDAGMAAGTAGIDADLAATDLTGISTDAEAAGAAAGTNLRRGVKGGLDDVEGDVAAAGANMGTLGEDAEKAGTGAGTSLEEGLGAGGLAGGAKLRAGVSSGLVGAEEDAEKAGTGIGTKLYTTLGPVANKAGLVLAGGIAVGTAAVVKMGLDYQTTTTQMAAAGNIPIKTANDIGQAFLHSKDDVIFAAKGQEQAYGAVVGQLSTLKGYADTARTATTFMATSMDLAEESGNSLKGTTGDLSGILQAFQVPMKGAANVSTDLFNASRLTSTGVDQVSSTLTTMKSKLGATAPAVSTLSSLLVDFGEHGLSGSRGLRQVGTAVTTLLKPTTDLTTAQNNLKTITAGLPPSLQALADKVTAGTITTTQLSAATEGMTTTQATAWAQFTTGKAKVDAAQLSVKEMGLTTDTAGGKFVGFGSIIGQLDEKLKGHTEAQQLSILSTDLGTTANKTMLDTVLAGPAAYAKATSSVTDAAAAHHALVVQQQTLGHEFDAIKTQVTDVGTEFGTDLLPVVKDVVGGVVDLTKAVVENKPVLEALGVVVGTVVVGAIGMWIAGLASGAATMLAGVAPATAFGARMASVATTLSDVSGKTTQVEMSTKQQSETQQQASNVMQQAAKALQQVADALQMYVDKLPTAETGNEGLTASTTELTAALEGETEAAGGAAGSLEALTAAQGEAAGTSAELGGAMGAEGLGKDAGVAEGALSDVGTAGAGAVGGIEEAGGSLGPFAIAAAGAGVAALYLGKGISSWTGANAVSSGLTKLVSAANGIPGTTANVFGMQVRLDALTKSMDKNGQSTSANLKTLKALGNSGMGPASKQAKALYDQYTSLQSAIPHINTNLSVLSSTFGISKQSAQGLAQSIGLNLNKSLSPDQIHIFSEALQQSGQPIDDTTAKIKGIADGAEAAGASLETSITTHISNATAATDAGAQRMVASIKSGDWTGAGQSSMDKTAVAISGDTKTTTAVKKNIDDAQTAGQAEAGKFASVGAAMAAGMAAGITANGANVVGSLTGLIDGTIAAAKATAKISSPSGLTRDEIGTPMGQGVLVGLQSTLPAINQFMGSVISGIPRAGGATMVSGLPSGTTGGAALPNASLGPAGPAPAPPTAPAAAAGKTVIFQNEFNNVPTSDANAIATEQAWMMKTASE